jgi:predicted RNA-binding protein (virulence factor B family)
MIITKLSIHALDRLATAYKAPVRTQKVIATVERCAQQGYVVGAKNEGDYVVYPDHGAFVVKDHVIVTFIHKSRMGEHGGCQRAYAQVMAINTKKKAA